MRLKHTSNSCAAPVQSFSSPGVFELTHRVWQALWIGAFQDKILSIDSIKGFARPAVTHFTLSVKAF